MIAACPICGFAESMHVVVSGSAFTLCPPNEGRSREEGIYTDRYVVVGASLDNAGTSGRGRT